LLTPNYTLWHGDCLIEMDNIPDGSINMILCDPPYGTTACKWDVVIPFEPLWKQYKRVIKPRGAIVLFGKQPFTSLLVASNLKWFKYEWIWEKSRASGFLNSPHMPMCAHDNILVFCEGVSTYNPQLWEISDYFIDRRRTFNPGENQNTTYGKWSRLPMKKDTGKRKPLSVLPIHSECYSGMHPTQKPVALLSYLIKTYTNEGEMILDNTCGSGSTLEAAMRNNRHSIGIEKDLGYFNVAQERLARVAAELRGDLDHLPMFKEMAIGTL